MQFTDPKAPGYTTVEASNGRRARGEMGIQAQHPPLEQISLHRRGEGLPEPWRHHHRPLRRSPVRLAGIRVQTYCEAAFEFHVLADPIATYDYVPVSESPRIAIVPGPGVKWQAILPTLARAGAPFKFALKIDDKWGNPSDKVSQTVRLVSEPAIDGLPKTVALQDGQFGAVVDGLTATPGDYVVRVLDSAGAELARANPLRVTDADAGLVHFWG